MGRPGPPSSLHGRTARGWGHRRKGHEQDAWICSVGKPAPGKSTFKVPALTSAPSPPSSRSRTQTPPLPLNHWATRGKSPPSSFPSYRQTGLQHLPHQAMEGMRRTYIPSTWKRRGTARKQKPSSSTPAPHSDPAHLEQSGKVIIEVG